MLLLSSGGYQNYIDNRSFKIKLLIYKLLGYNINKLNKEETTKRNSKNSLFFSERK